MNKHQLNEEQKELYEASLYVTMYVVRQRPRKIDDVNLEHVLVVAGHTSTRLHMLLSPNQLEHDPLPKPEPFTPRKHTRKVEADEV